MIRLSAALAMLGLSACEGSLADLWQPPIVPQQRSAPKVKIISGRIGVLVSQTAPRQVAPSQDERINITHSVSLGSGVWIVLTRIPLIRSKTQLRLSSGQVIDGDRLDRLLSLAPRAVVGLRLDDQLNVIEDTLGLKRQGRVIGCGGDPIDSALALRACLALAHNRDAPALKFEAPVVLPIPSVSRDAGRPLADQQVRADAGASSPVDVGEPR